MTPDTPATPAAPNAPANLTPFDVLTPSDTPPDDTPANGAPAHEAAGMEAPLNGIASPEIFVEDIPESVESVNHEPAVQKATPTPIASAPSSLPKPQGERSRRPLIAAIFFALLVGGGAGGWWWRNELIRRWEWEAIPMREAAAYVPKEWPVAELAARLKESRKIRDRDTFLEAAAQTGLRQVAPGGYVLPAKAGPLELAKIFHAPPALVKVTFPEGWTGARMAARLQARDFPHAAELRRLIYPPQHAVSPWEGRLFPETYWLPQRGTAPQLVAQMHDRFKTVMQGLPRPLPIGAKGKRLTLDEVVTLASIVERETGVPDERPIVAGVLINRLQKGMRLQCDATVQYALERAKASGQLPTGRQSRLRFRDIDAVRLSPYNTYKIKALPPGPICNPGEAALFAAAKPKPSKYLFYVMSPRLGHHRFATDFAGHSRNVRLYKQELGN